MSEDIDWLWVVLDYGRRFPDMTYGGLLGTYHNYKISNMIRLDNRIVGHDSYIFFRTHPKFSLIYWNTYSHFPVPPQILLRLLTEGKEDLI